MESESRMTYFTMLQPHPLFEWRIIFTISAHHISSPYCLDITSSKTKCHLTCGIGNYPQSPLNNCIVTKSLHVILFIIYYSICIYFNICISIFYNKLFYISVPIA